MCSSDLYLSVSVSLSLCLSISLCLPPSPSPCPHPSLYQFFNPHTTPCTPLSPRSLCRPPSLLLPSPSSVYFLSLALYWVRGGVTHTHTHTPHPYFKSEERLFIRTGSSPPVSSRLRAPPSLPPAPFFPSLPTVSSSPLPVPGHYTASPWACLHRGNERSVRFFLYKIGRASCRERV